MDSERVPITYLAGAASPPFTVALREPCGRDELAVCGIATRNAVALLERLLDGVSWPDATTVADLSAHDRDGLLAALHRLCWGDRIVATVTCRSCNERFDLSFTLSRLQQELAQSKVELAGSWRVPTAADELASAAHQLPAAQLHGLAERCGAGLADLAAVAAALEAAAPILDVDLAVVCPECNADQQVAFDLQSFLLRRLLAERELLLDEVHTLASQYGWSLGDILNLTRSSRRTLVQRISKGRSV